MDFSVEKLVLWILVEAVKRANAYGTPVEVELAGLFHSLKESLLATLAKLSDTEFDQTALS